MYSHIQRCTCESSLSMGACPVHGVNPPANETPIDRGDYGFPAVRERLREAVEAQQKINGLRGTPAVPAEPEPALAEAFIPPKPIAFLRAAATLIHDQPTAEQWQLIKDAVMSIPDPESRS